MIGRVVKLERPVADDYALMLKWLAPDGAVAPLTGDMGDEPTVEDLQQMNRSGNQRFLMIKLLSDGTPVGTMNYRRDAPGAYSIGAAVGDPALWHAGYAGDAFIVLLDLLFHSKNARKVSGMVMSFNKHSMRMMVNGGFVCEGILREHCYLDGKWHDAVMWSMLRSEFYERAERHAAMSDRLRLQDLVPAEDKKKARQALAGYLRSARLTTSFDQFLQAEDDKDE
jgi:RimJ/RimL family protein N-acetyltransferase